MDCSLPGSSVHGTLQARTLEWVAISSSRIRCWTSLIITGGCKLKWQWQIKSRRSEWPFSHVTGNSARASQEEREPTYTVRGNGHWQQPLESTASLCREWGGNTFQKAKPRIWHSHTWAYIPRKPSFENPHAPQHSLQHCLQQPRLRSSKVSAGTLKLKEDVVHMYSGPQLNHDNRHCKYEITPLVTTRMDLGGSDTSQTDRGRK